MKTAERRSFKFETKNVKKDDKKKTITIEGHAAIFNSPSDSGGLAWFTEEIMPGAFKDAIKEDDVRALFNHDSNYVMGRNTAGTLELKEDDNGDKDKTSGEQKLIFNPKAKNSENIREIEIDFTKKD